MLFQSKTEQTTTAPAAARTETLEQYARRLISDEDELVRRTVTHDARYDRFKRFVDGHLCHVDSMDPCKAGLLHDALLRMMCIEEIRAIAINQIPYLCPFEKAQAQVVLISALGRFMKDESVSDFIEDVASGTAGGIMSMNKTATNTARQISSTSRGAEEPILPQEDSLRRFGVKL